MKRPTRIRGTRGTRGTRAAAGFTIVEVVLAMFILLIGMSSILGLLSFGAALSRNASLRTGAAHSIEAVLADLEENLFPLVLVDGHEVVGEPREITDRGIPGFEHLKYSATATPLDAGETGTAGAPLEYRVDVEVSWNSPGSKRSRTFTTLLLREVPFGERMRRRFVEGIEPKPVEDTPRASSGESP